MMTRQRDVAMDASHTYLQATICFAVAVAVSVTNQFIASTGQKNVLQLLLHRLSAMVSFKTALPLRLLHLVCMKEISSGPSKAPGAEIKHATQTESTPFKCICSCFQEDYSRTGTVPIQCLCNW
jgi:hypothetical protein